MNKYIYCDSHGAVHFQREVDEKVWCTAAQKTGLELYYPATLQQDFEWADEDTIRWAAAYCKQLGLWLYDPSRPSVPVDNSK